jgi:DNA repair protein RecO (recombination protein O)
MSAIERVELQPAFVLHVRAWRESSGIVDLVTRDYGRVSLVARGMRRPRGLLRALLQPFQPLAVSWSGRGGGLMSLRAAEAAGGATPLPVPALLSGFYLNELVLRFLHRGDPHPRLFAAYGRALAGLAFDDRPEPSLRRFEMELLAEAGYGLNLDHDAQSGEPLDPAGRYCYVIDQGPVPVGPAAGGELVFDGAELMAIGRGELAGSEQLRSARRLLRAALDHHLGGKPLRTREVFAAMKR